MKLWRRSRIKVEVCMKKQLWSISIYKGATVNCLWRSRCKTVMLMKEQFLSGSMYEESALKWCIWSRAALKWCIWARAALKWCIWARAALKWCIWARAAVIKLPYFEEARHVNCESAVFIEHKALYLFQIPVPWVATYHGLMLLTFPN